MDRKEAQVFVYLFACFFSRISRDWEHLQDRKWSGSVVDSPLLRHVFSAVVFPAKAWTDRSSHGLNIMIRVIAATVARDIDSDSSLPKLRN